MHVRRLRTGTLARCALRFASAIAPRKRARCGQGDIPAFFRPPPGRAGDFLLHGQEKSHQRKGHRLTRIPRATHEAICPTSLRARPGWPAIEANPASSPDAAAHSRSREQGVHVRAQGSASSRRREIGEHQGQSSRHDVGETVMPGAAVLATFAVTKVTRAPRGAWNQDTEVITTSPLNVAIVQRGAA